MRNRSVMEHQFSRIPQVEIQRSSFDRSHGYKTTFDAGRLVPIFLDEALPGDTFNLNMTGFARLATPIKPLMDNLHMETFFFSVPMRLVWDNWEKFNGAQDNPGDSTDYVIPTTTVIAGQKYNQGSIADYFGLPTANLNPIKHSALPLRAYKLIWNEWFRDQNLQDSVVISTGDGPDAIDQAEPYRRGKRHDYFTSCLPWPQKGESVDIPLGTTAPVLPNGDFPTFDTADLNGVPLKGTVTSGVVDIGAPNATANIYWGDPNLEVNLSSATAATINQLREAFQLQKMLERDARGGTRYTEVIRSHFGVTSPDARLQRPEFLGGGKSMVNISPVAQTNATDTGIDTPQANLAAIGTAALHNHGFTKSFTEHCIIIGMVNVRADLTYQQGMNRMWARETRYDFYWPALAHIGEQGVLNQEIYAGTTQNKDIFGYQERYAEYRYKPSLITGKFRSTDAQSLDIWHLSQEFSSLPVLSNTFIEDNPPIDRVIAVPSEPHFLFDAHFNLRCARPMPLYGTPGNIDRF